jgi:hypothetical protein
MTTFGPSDWMKNKKTTVLQYTRISDNQQSKADKKIKDAKKKPALIQQKQTMDAGLKASKLPTVKSGNWYAEVQSGTNRDRPEWNKMMAKAQELTHEGKRVFIAVQDPSRWARNSRHSMVAIDKLHDMGVPIFAVREGIQTGSVGDLHPTEELLFVQLQGGASFVSQEQKKKADISVEQSKEAGIMAGKGQPLFPFARIDPLTAYYGELPLLTLSKKEGGGPVAFRRAVSSRTQPNGVSESGMNRFMMSEIERKEKLSPTEYEEWRDYRQMIRNMLIDFNHDPFANNTESGPIDFRARALMRMVGRYLKEPWKYSQRSDEEIENIILNYKEFLGTKDLKRYSAIVGHR